MGLLLAAGCAVATNVASVLKHRGANAVPAFRVESPIRSLRMLLRSRWFAVGLALAQVAGILHIASLALAPMSVVQVVLAAGVVLLAGLAERILGCAVPRRQRIGLFCAAAGLALLVVCMPQLRGAHGSCGWPTLLGFEAVVLLSGLALAFTQRIASFAAHRGVLLGAAGGAFFGLSDVAVKAITGLVGQGAAGAAVPWLIVAVTGGIAAQVFAVRGLQEGEAVPVIGLTGVTANIANIAGGIVVFGDPLGHGPLAWSGETLAFILVVAGSALVPSSGTRRAEPARSVPALKAA